MPRCGTTYTLDLLALHPDCSQAAPYLEDLLLVDAHHLADYTAALCERWQRLWNVSNNVRFALMKSMGNALVEVLGEHVTAPRVLTKSPTVANLHLFFELFPAAKLVIVVRDGRSILASSMRSFDTPFDEGLQRWAKAARTIQQFMNTTNPDRYLLVKYENLFLQPTQVMTQMLEYLQLDAERYPFDAVGQVPVRGSCESRAPDGSVNWDPVARSNDFNPLDRWRELTAQQLEQFEWWAGSRLREFGYPLRTNANRPVTRARCWLSYRRQRLWHRIAKQMPAGLHGTFKAS